MNRQERLAIWQDETAHPGSPTTWAALAVSGANLHIMEEWRDLEGDPEPGSPWTTYADFLKGAISIAQDHDPKEEFETPAEHIHQLVRLQNLWEELWKITNEPHNAVGEDQAERDAYQAILVRREENRLLHEKAQAMFVKPPLSIISIPGKLYARYDITTKHVLGFGFMPHAGDAGYFGPSNVPEEGTAPTSEEFWEAVRTYLNNVNEISGESAMAVVWEEDGWQT